MKTLFIFHLSHSNQGLPWLVFLLQLLLSAVSRWQHWQDPPVALAQDILNLPFNALFLGINTHKLQIYCQTLFIHGSLQLQNTAFLFSLAAANHTWLYFLRGALATLHKQSHVLNRFIKPSIIIKFKHKINSHVIMDQMLLLTAREDVRTLNAPWAQL